MTNGPAGNGHDLADGGNAFGGLSEAALREALRRGVITWEQMHELQALAHEELRPAGRREVSVAAVLYWVGAIAVLFALGYFLVDRWRSLRPGGVLAVVTMYATAFMLASSYLGRTRQQLAAQLFALLAVGMAPVAMWALLSIVGLWPEGATTFAGPSTADVFATIRWLPIELSAALAALVALRRVQFAILSLCVAIPFAVALIHITPLVFDPWLDPYIWGWMALLAAAGLLAAAAEVDRRDRYRVDYAALVYLTGLVYSVVGLTVVAGQSRVILHSLPLVVALMIGLSLLTRRSMFLLFGLIYLLFYLGFLGADVFATATAFMVVMVASGAALILATVFVQKRWPALAKSFSRDSEPRRVFRGSRELFTGLVVVALVLLAFAPRQAREARQKEVESLKSAGRINARARRAAREGRPMGEVLLPAPSSKAETPTRRQP